MQRRVFHNVRTDYWGEKTPYLVMTWTHRITALGTTFPIEAKYEVRENQLSPENAQTLDTNMTQRVMERAELVKSYLTELEKLGFNQSSSRKVVD